MAFDERRQVTDAIAQMRLRHALVRSVNFDGNSDGGAELFVMTIRAFLPNCTVEVVVQDFQGSRSAMEIVFDARSNILNRNFETVPRLYDAARVGSDYGRYQMMLRHASLAVGDSDQIGHHVGTRRDRCRDRRDPRSPARARRRDTNRVQYLRPSPDHLAIRKYYNPGGVCADLRLGRELGFRHVESGALVSSRYHADEGVVAL